MRWSESRISFRLKQLKSPSPSGNQTWQWSLQTYGGLWLGSSTFPWIFHGFSTSTGDLYNQRLILQQRNTFFDIPEDDADLPEGPATCPPASDGWWPSSSSRPSSVPWTSQWKFNGEGKNVSWKLRRKPKKTWTIRVWKMILHLGCRLLLPYVFSWALVVP